MAGIQISMCVQLSGLEIMVYDCLDEVLGLASYIASEMEIISFLDLLVLKVDITFLCSFI